MQVSLDWLEVKGLWVLADYGASRPAPDLERNPELYAAARRGYMKLQVILHATYGKPDFSLQPRFAGVSDEENARLLALLEHYRQTVTTMSGPDEPAQCEHHLPLTASCAKCDRWCNELTPTPEE